MIKTNGIPDHNSWAITGGTSHIRISEPHNEFSIPAVPKLVSIEQALTQVVPQGFDAGELNEKY